MVTDTESASAAGVVMFILCIVVVGGMYLFLATPMFGAATGAYNNMTQTIAPTQAQQDSMVFLQLVYADFPVLILILTVIAAVVIALRERNSVV